MGTQTVATETEFNVLQFEKKLTSLKDSQESINTCCQWCLQNRQHHKKIVNAWLNVLKRVKIEQRLTLFYLANDVVQYSKKRNYEFVESWGTAIQKATTMVRDEKVKHKILRIFKIWEQRGVYNEEFISDLCGLISVVPSAPKGDEPHEFQPNYVVNKIKACTKLESDTDVKLKLLKEHNPKIQITPELYSTLKDRAHLDDVEKEIEVYTKHMEDYINALKLEIKNRITLISVLKQAETQLEADRKDVKLVAHAYKMFGMRVKTFQKKLQEHTETLSSPIPSPDINAPSPSPDSDIEFTEVENTSKTDTSLTDFSSSIQFTNPGYYNPVPPPSTDPTENSFLSNGFSSFLGSSIPFDLQNLNNSLFSNALSETASTATTTTRNYTAPVQPPLPVEAPVISQDSSYFSSSHVPLLPPPMPPFSSKSDGRYNNVNYNPANAFSGTSPAPYVPSYGDTSFANSDSSFNTSLFGNSESDFNASNPFTRQESYEPPAGANPYPPTSEEYNPEQEIESWEPDGGWGEGKEIDTPESPPMFEKESFVDPIEYHDNAQSGAVDVDHRVLPILSVDLDDSLSSLGGKDVDHRNLISLTGSPAPDTNSNSQNNDSWNQSDKDYRTQANATLDQDYRLPFEIPNMKLPPPPPPPPKPLTLPNHQSANTDAVKPQPPSKSPRKFQDNVECTDMDLSDDETESAAHKSSDNLKVLIESSNETFSLEPPPPLPDLPDDVDANNFLDDLSNDLHEFSNLSDDLSGGMWETGPPLGMNMHPGQHPNMPLRMESPRMPPHLNSPHQGPPPPHMMNLPPPNNWMPDENPNWIPEEDLNWMPDNWQGNNDNWQGNNDNWQGNNDNWQGNSPNFNNFRGRGNNRGNFNNSFNMGKGTPRGRGRGNFNNFRGPNNFRGRSPRGGHRGGGGGGGMHRPKGNFRGNFRGGY